MRVLVAAALSRAVVAYDVARTPPLGFNSAHAAAARASSLLL
jgi:hypothetical protein